MYMTPDEQQGILIIMGSQANTIRSLQESLSAAYAEIQRLNGLQDELVHPPVEENGKAPEWDLNPTS